MGIKLISALSFALLGYVGWELQRTNTQNAERRKDAEIAEAARVRAVQEEEQRFLPLFDSLASIEFMLDEALSQRTDARTFYLDLADALRWRNASLFIPPNFHPKVKLSSSGPMFVKPYFHMPLGAPKSVDEVPLRDAIGMTAEFLRVAVVCENLSNAGAHVRSTRLNLEGTVLTLDGEYGDEPRPPHHGDGMEYPPEEQKHLLLFPREQLELSEEYLDAWERWIYGPDKDSDQFVMIGDHFGVSRQLLLDLRLEIARLQRDTLMQHPGLAEKYLAVRTNILANKTFRRPPRVFDVDDDVRLNATVEPSIHPTTEAATRPVGAAY